MIILKSGFQVFLAAYLLLHPKTDIIYGIYASCIPRRAIKSTHWDPPPPVWCVGVAASCPGATSQSHVLRLEVVDLWQLNEGKFVQIFFLEKIFRSCLKQISGSAPEIYFFPMILKLSKKVGRIGFEKLLLHCGDFNRIKEKISQNIRDHLVKW